MVKAVKYVQDAAHHQVPTVTVINALKDFLALIFKCGYNTCIKHLMSFCNGLNESLHA